MFHRILAGALSLALPLPALADLPPLGQVSTVWEGLVTVAIAYEIGERCDDVDARIFVGLAYLGDLKAEARRLGYTDDQIDAFIDDEAEKDRLEAVARERLATMGVVRGDPESHCVAGRAEIDAGSAVGRLLNG